MPAAAGSIEESPSSEDTGRVTVKPYRESSVRERLIREAKERAEAARHNHKESADDRTP